MALGLVVAVGRVYGPRWLRIPLGVYVEVIRGTPLLLQLYALFYMIPVAVQAVSPALAAWFTPFVCGVVGLAINYSAYEAENYRAGLLAIPKGQTEAALALGLSRWEAIRRVVVPQAVRIVIPPVTNDFIALFKDTSVCSAILIVELTRKYNELYNFNRELIVQLVFITAGLYLLMSYPLSLVAHHLERRFAGRPTGGAA
jgi:polar amino acid transport system substrate-binding protein